MQKNIPSQVHMEHSPGETISWVTDQTSVNLRKLKSYQVAPLTTGKRLDMRLDINYKKKNYKKHKQMEIKKHISKSQLVTEEIKR